MRISEGLKPDGGWGHYLQLLVIARGLFAATLMVMDDLLICHSNTPDTMIDDHDDGEDAIHCNAL